mgnify:CR=1 FL=1
MPERTSYEWQDKQIAGASPVAIVSYRLDMGEVYYAERPLRDSELPVYGATFKATVKFKGTVLFSGGRTVLENAGRLRSVSSARESIAPVETALAASSGRIEQPEVLAELDNGDAGLSVLVGEHYLLGKPARLLVGFAGLDIRHALVRATGHISRVRLTARTMTIEAGE